MSNLDDLTNILSIISTVASFVLAGQTREASGGRWPTLSKHEAYKINYIMKPDVLHDHMRVLVVGNLLMQVKNIASYVILTINSASLVIDFALTPVNSTL